MNNQSLITNDLLTTAFRSVTANTALFESRSDFHIICSIRAYDLIIALKVAPDGGEVSLLREFNKEFLKRMKFWAWLAQTSIVIGIIYGGFEIISEYPFVKEYIDKIGSVLKVLGAVGISQLVNLLPIVKKKSHELLLRLFGYPKELINEQ